MAQGVDPLQKNLSDFVEVVNSLIPEIISYELRIRGVQPAQALSTKRAQLSRELLNENNGNQVEFGFYLAPLEDLRACAALNARFDGNLTSNLRTATSIRATNYNLIFLEIRVKRIQCISMEENNMKRILLANISGSIDRAQTLLQTPTEIQQDIIDLTSHGIGNNSQNRQSHKSQSANLPPQQNNIFNAQQGEQSQRQ